MLPVQLMLMMTASWLLIVCLSSCIACLATVFNIYVNNGITSINSFVTVSVLSFSLTISAYLESCLSNQISFLQYVPLSWFHCSFFRVACSYILAVWSLSVQVDFSCSFLSTHQLLYYCLYPASLALSWYSMVHVSISSLTLLSTCCVIFSLTHHVGNLPTGWGYASYLVVSL